MFYTIRVSKNLAVCPSIFRNRRTSKSKPSFLTALPAFIMKNMTYNPFKCPFCRYRHLPFTHDCLNKIFSCNFYFRYFKRNLQFIFLLGIVSVQTSINSYTHSSSSIKHLPSTGCNNTCSATSLFRFCVLFRKLIPVDFLF